MTCEGRGLSPPAHTRRGLPTATASCILPQLRQAAKTARDILLGPVVGARGYDMEVTWRYQQAAAIVNRWPGLTHDERIWLNRSLPWTECVCLLERELLGFDRSAFLASLGRTA